jgi:SAM-dependent methyltransferase
LEINCVSQGAREELEGIGNLKSAITLAGDLESLGVLPLPDGMFDKVVIVNSVEYSPYPEALLREVRRVLRPGGRLVAQVPSLSYREATAEVQGLYQETFGTREMYTRASAEPRLREVGFVITDWLYTFNSPLAHRLFTWAMRQGQRGRAYQWLSPPAYHLCKWSDRMAGRPNEGHFLIIQATATEF